MSELTETYNEKRYFVRLVRGIAMGGGMYAVFDGYEGHQIGEPTCWRNDAEMTAIRLNNAAILKSISQP